ncbi:hypothetical protein BJX96DRAFT_15435 [Aspergillus floccosus]
MLVKGVSTIRCPSSRARIGRTGDGCGGQRLDLRCALDCLIELVYLFRTQCWSWVAAASGNGFRAGTVRAGNCGSGLGHALGPPEDEFGMPSGKGTFSGRCQVLIGHLLNGWVGRGVSNVPSSGCETIRVWDKDGGLVLLGRQLEYDDCRWLERTVVNSAWWTSGFPSETSCLLSAVSGGFNSSRGHHDTGSTAY